MKMMASDWPLMSPFSLMTLIPSQLNTEDDNRPEHALRLRLRLPGGGSEVKSTL